MAFISVLFGNVWALVNPWSILFLWISRALGNLTPLLTYPTRLGCWPAVVLLFGFAWLELISEFGEKPRVLGALIMAYSAITWCAMTLFGRELWLKNGELFSMYSVC